MSTIKTRQTTPLDRFKAVFYGGFAYVASMQSPRAAWWRRETGGPCPLLRHHRRRHHNLIAGRPTGGELHPSAPQLQPVMTMTMTVAMACVVKPRTLLVSESSRKWIGL